jgi:hypothetical protein
MHSMIDSTWELVGYDNWCILFYSILFYSIQGMDLVFYSRNQKRYEKGFSSIDSHLRGDRDKSTSLFFYYLKYLLGGLPTNSLNLSVPNDRSPQGVSRKPIHFLVSEYFLSYLQSYLIMRFPPLMGPAVLKQLRSYWPLWRPTKKRASCACGISAHFCLLLVCDS